MQYKQSYQNACHCALISVFFFSQVKKNHSKNFIFLKEEVKMTRKIYLPIFNMEINSSTKSNASMNLHISSWQSSSVMIIHTISLWIQIVHLEIAVIFQSCNTSQVLAINEVWGDLISIYGMFHSASTEDCNFA